MTKQVIICVDDEATILRSLKAELKEAFGNEYLIESADSGVDALELLQELLDDEYEVPLIISDYIMPDLRGDELLKRVHQISPKTVKVMLTGQATIEAVSNAINYAKLYRYLAKPWQAEDLKLTVTEAIYSYLQDKKLAEQNLQLQRLNQEQSLLIAQLHKKEHRWTQFLEAMPVGVVVFDAQRNPYYINQRAQELLAHEIIPEIKPEQIAEIYQNYIAGTNNIYPTENLPIFRALNGERTNADDIEIHRGDQIIPIETWGTPIYDEFGQVAYAIAAFQDITDRRKSEAERAEFINQLSKVNCELEQSLEAEFNLTDAYGRFVPHQFLSLLNYESILDVKLGDAVQLEMSILFSDIREFTALSESMTPEDNFKFINAYLSRMEPAILENKGFIDKYIGDGIMALFNGIADDALKAGLSMLNILHQYNHHRLNSGYLPIKIGIGINTGSLMLGTVGGTNRMDSTVISDDVNLAARLEELTKQYGVSLLISHQTLARLQNPTVYNIRFIEQAIVKGKSKAVGVFEVFDGDATEIRQGKLVTKTCFEEGLFMFYQQFFREAAKRFAYVLSVNPRDSVAQIYLKRCQLQETSRSLPLI